MLLRELDAATRARRSFSHRHSRSPLAYQSYSCIPELLQPLHLKSSMQERMQEGMCMQERMQEGMCKSACKSACACKSAWHARAHGK
jgi:hypothetical protein